MRSKVFLMSQGRSCDRNPAILCSTQHAIQMKCLTLLVNWLDWSDIVCRTWHSGLCSFAYFLSHSTVQLPYWNSKVFEKSVFC